MLSFQKNANSFKSPKLKRLKLQAFRCFDQREFEFEGKHIFISGANGAGKTAILEALSVFAPGRGLRQSKLSEIQSQQMQNQAWCVNLDLLTPHGQSFELATAYDFSSDSEKRLIKANHTVIKQAELQDILQLVWLTPQLERQFHDSNSARRKFIDRLIAQHDPAHMGRVFRYEKLMSQRSYLIKQGKYDPLWVEVLEQDLSKTAVSIIAVRLDFIDQLQEYCEDLTSEFPEIQLSLIGDIESDLSKYSALEVEQHLFETLKKARILQDISPQGAHKSKVELIYKENNIAYRLCSTGQQKAIFIRLILGHMALLKSENQVAPIVLLDDIHAHLDESRLRQLICELDQTESQIFYSSTYFPNIEINNKFREM